MTSYRRANRPGATYFFTINLGDRRSPLLIDRIDDLRDASATRANAIPSSSMR